VLLEFRLQAVLCAWKSNEDRLKAELQQKPMWAGRTARPLSFNDEISAPAATILSSATEKFIPQPTYLGRFRQPSNNRQTSDTNAQEIPFRPE
jgi:hypothetical protein